VAQASALSRQMGGYRGARDKARLRSGTAGPAAVCGGVVGAIAALIEAYRDRGHSQNPSSLTRVPVAALTNEIAWAKRRAEAQLDSRVLHILLPERVCGRRE